MTTAYQSSQSTHNDVITNLQDYVLSTKNLTLFTKHMLTKEPNVSTKIKNTNTKPIVNTKTIVNNQRSNPDIYRPKQKDSLFWCFYILKNGYSKYEMEVNDTYFVVEKTEKFKYVNSVREKKDMLKIYKIKPLTEIEQDLANSEQISLKTFFALCVIENINVMVIDKRKYYECIVNDDQDLNILSKDDMTNNYVIQLNVTKEKIQHYRDNYYKIHNFETSLKAMSSYKMEDLHEIGKKLNLDINKLNDNKDKKKITKKDLYEHIVMNF
jgi:hypothetical protein